jgi:hypothetical protein
VYVLVGVFKGRQQHSLRGMPKNPSGVVHLWGWLQGHRVVWDVSHEAFGVAEVEVPGVQQG